MSKKIKNLEGLLDDQNSNDIWKDIGCAPADIQIWIRVIEQGKKTTLNILNDNHDKS